MKKVFVVLSLMMFVGSMTSTAIAASNGTLTEIKKNDDKKKKKKAKKGSCCATEKTTTKSCCSKGTKTETEKK
ncbi:MAG: hypothetical protein ACK5B9_03325 [Flavobacteriia bacterium]|jgi:hypothetical protein